MPNNFLQRRLFLILTAFIVTTLFLNPLLQKEAPKETNLSIVSASCVLGMGSHQGVPLSHARVVLNHKGFPFHHWMEIVVRDQNTATKYMVGHWGPNEVSTTELDGYVSSLFGTGFVIDPEKSYTLRVWRNSSDEFPPQFEERDLLFEGEFQIPECM